MGGWEVGITMTSAGWGGVGTIWRPPSILACRRWSGALESTVFKPKVPGSSSPDPSRSTVSEDGNRWVEAGRVDLPLESEEKKAAVRVVVEFSPELDSHRVRFVRVLARNQGSLPEWHPGSPEDAWLFVDEIVVEGE